MYHQSDFAEYKKQDAVNAFLDLKEHYLRKESDNQFKRVCKDIGFSFTRMSSSPGTSDQMEVDSAPVPDIVHKLEAQDAAIRRTAAYVLGSLKDPRAVHDLKIALNDSSEDVRWNAAIALAQLNDASGSDLLTKLLDRDYVDKLEGMTAEQKSQLVINAIKCLGILKFQGAKDKILALSQNDPDLAVRNASLEALKKF